MNRKKTLIVILSLVAFSALSCNLPFFTTAAATEIPFPTLPPPAAIPEILAATEVPILPTPVLPTSTPAIVHVLFPELLPDVGNVIYDVISQDTAAENRAPYGDSYKINRLERPFQQDMIYVSDLDIATYSLSEDAQWYYVSIELIGKNPNNDIGINYGVEIDNDADGFGDVIIWAESPYSDDWTNLNVQVLEDKNHDTAGLSPGFSDAPIDTDGYETLIFDRGLGNDPDLAWVRSNAGMKATIQFAFKKSLTDGSFMLGVIADAGLRDVTKLDYVDRFTIEEAGSPVRDNKNYPLRDLYLVDNTCREAFGFGPTGYEPQLCPRPEKSNEPDGGGCSNPGQYSDASSCTQAGCAWVQDPTVLVAVIYHCVAP